jgi:hypothetical protein
VRPPLLLDAPLVDNDTSHGRDFGRHLLLLCIVWRAAAVALLLYLLLHLPLLHLHLLLLLLLLLQLQLLLLLHLHLLLLLLLLHLLLLNLCLHLDLLHLLWRVAARADTRFASARRFWSWSRTTSCHSHPSTSDERLLPTSCSQKGQSRPAAHCHRLTARRPAADLHI